MSCAPIFSGDGFAAARIEPVCMVSVCFSPIRPLCQFESFLGSRRAIFGLYNGPVILAGDFNAKSTLWGSHQTDPRGSTLEGWAEEMQLQLFSSAPTCVRPQGTSCVDLTWGNARAVRYVTVLQKTESLSAAALHRERGHLKKLIKKSKNAEWQKL